MPSPPPETPVIRLVDVRASPLSVDEVLAAVRDPRAGGTAVFVGAVRDHDEPAAAPDAGPGPEQVPRAVDRLDYSAHPGARAALDTVVAEVVAAHDVVAVAAVHRVGDLVVGDLAVVVAVAAVHRGEAFDGCRSLIDELKSRVPIWKHQVFSDGEQEWVGLP